MPHPRAGPHTEDLAQAFRLVGDSNRLRLLCALFESPDICVSELGERFGLSVAITSHHLKALARGGLLEARRDGKRICYTLPRTGLPQDLKRFICHYKQKTPRKTKI